MRAQQFRPGCPFASQAWWNNWWVGYNTAGTLSCDLNGNFTVGIQRINWHMGYRQSGVDGSYGPGTHQDVRSYQAFSGLFLLDGLVGHDTWYSYGTRAKLCGYNGSFDLYKIGSCSGPITFARDVATSPQMWYVAGLPGTWQRFWMFGPS